MFKNSIDTILVKDSSQIKLRDTQKFGSSPMCNYDPAGFDYGRGRPNKTHEEREPLSIFNLEKDDDATNFHVYEIRMV